MHCSLISTLYLMIYLLCSFLHRTLHNVYCCCSVRSPCTDRLKFAVLCSLSSRSNFFCYFIFNQAPPTFLSYLYLIFDFFFFLSHFISKSVFVPRTHTLQSNTHLYSYFLNGFELCFAFEIFSYRSKFAWNESSVLVDKRVSVKYLICCLRTKYDMRIFLDRYIICLELDF